MSRLFNLSANRVLAPRAECVSGGLSLFRGLMGQNVPTDFALGLKGCDWVHTVGVRVPLDIMFCDPNRRVLRIFCDVPPFRLLPRVRGAVMAWEMVSGGFSPARVSPGDVVAFE